MSRIGSSSASGVRVAAEPLSNVFTVLLLIGALALVLAALMLWGTLDKRYGVTFGASDAGKAALDAPAKARAAQQAADMELTEMLAAIRRFPEAISKKAAPAEGGQTPPEVAPPAATPPEVAPPAAAPPAATPPEAAPPAATPPAATPPEAAPPAATPPVATPPAATPPEAAPPAAAPPAAAAPAAG
ncbi:MAG: hypothetical protein IMZ44_05195 [Planctomycetes bacterium]|nr:hypothetical protein [Planctomycetota bacterium]